MIEFVGRLFSDDRLEPQEKKELLTIIKKSIDDIVVEENKPADK